MDATTVLVAQTAAAFVGTLTLVLLPLTARLSQEAGAPALYQSVCAAIHLSKPTLSPAGGRSGAQVSGVEDSCRCVR